MKKRNTVEVHCYSCKQGINIEPYRLKKTKRFFCGKPCQNEWQRSAEYKLIHAQHHKYKEIKCSYCQEKFSRRITLINEQYNFCDRECRNLFISDFNEIYNPNPKKPKISTYCLQCRLPIAVFESVFKKNKFGHFCTHECYWSWKSIHISAEHHPQYKRNKVKCDNCFTEMDITDSELEKNKHNFCTQQCYWQFRSKYYVGENSYWLGKKRPELAESSRNNMLKMLTDGKMKKDSKIFNKVNELLNKMDILYENEKNFGYYSVDHYLTDFNLVIETMGDYWHGSPLKYPNYEQLNSIQIKDINRDKRKQTYLKNKGINILYLWEKDIKQNENLCKLLIAMYVEKKDNWRITIASITLDMKKD